MLLATNKIKVAYYLTIISLSFLLKQVKLLYY